MIDPQTLLGLGSGIVGAIVQLKKQSDQDRHNMTMAALSLKNEVANDAESRGSAFGRWFAIIIILSVGFGGLIYSAASDIPVTQIIEKEPFLDLLGLIKIGGGQGIVKAEGFVIPEYVENSIISIIFFLFGSTAAKR